MLREPVGVVAAIVPFNGPLMSAAAKIAPSLAAGCPIVFKPAPETPLDAFALADAAEAVGLPPGVLNILPADREIGERLVSHPGVDRVVFTGSTQGGRRGLIHHLPEFVTEALFEIAFGHRSVLFGSA